ncbi:MAG: hypothetical protein CYPHOPRED_002828 [Cyphobasidiales sp. Tagirdzhanova-0007]|nr:MAG: hypothetical protein CYPHOPRED_002828 [Cyphobasidiales sp. Tagirdzhanova-0007]
MRRLHVRSERPKSIGGAKGQHTTQLPDPHMWTHSRLAWPGGMEVNEDDLPLPLPPLSSTLPLPSLSPLCPSPPHSSLLPPLDPKLSRASALSRFPVWSPELNTSLPSGYW